MSRLGRIIVTARRKGQVAFDERFIADIHGTRAFEAAVLGQPFVERTFWNWQRNFNNNVVGLGSRISDNEARAILKAVQSGFENVFAEAYRAAGYQVVASPAPDVLRLRTGIANLEIAAPYTMSAGRSRTYARSAGEASLILEARDSMSGAILGRGVDRREAGDNAFVLRRTRASNSADFERMFRSWAQLSAQALSALRATPPVGQPPMS